MAVQQTLTPDALLAASVNVGGVVGDLQGLEADPTTTTGSYTTVPSANTNVILAVSFGAITVGNQTLTGTQSISIIARPTQTNTNSGQTASGNIQLYENGTALATTQAWSLAPQATPTFGEIGPFTFNPSLLSDTSGAGVEIRVIQNSGGQGGGRRNHPEFDYILWTANVGDAVSPGKSQAVWI